MQPRVKRHLEQIDELVDGLEKHIRLKMVESMDISDADSIGRAIDDFKDRDLTVSDLFKSLDGGAATSPLDADWLRRVTQLLAKLKHLKWQYTTGISKQGRASLGFINATGCTSVWGSTFPFNPYPFPWSSHLFQDSPSVAMGVFEGHMAKMAEGFKAIRMAEIELDGGYSEEKNGEFFTYFDWKQFSDEEFALCPPVVAVGGDGAMYDIGFQNLSRMMMSGKPVKALILDTQVYSNTGGQACTSGFTGQVSDMAQFGKAHQGKEEIRKEIALIGMAHRTTYVAQSAISNMSHLIESFIEGLNARRPALFNIYCPCQPEHGVADDTGVRQSKLAVESRAYPLFRYNPDNGITPSECFDLEGNPALDDDWPVYELHYTDEDGKEASMELPMTFADFAVTEARFRKQFKTAPPETWNEDMVPMAEFVELDAEDREGLFPYIWTVDTKNRLTRVIPAQPLVESVEDRLHFWKMLKDIALHAETVDSEGIVNGARAQMAQQLATGLMQLVLNGEKLDIESMLQGASALEFVPAPSTALPTAPSAGTATAPAAAVAATVAAAAATATAATAVADDNGYVAPWLDSKECTACDECTNINSKIFAYDGKKLAYIKDPKGGPYKDIVRAAEKCTAKIIHPGYPEDRSQKGIDRLIKRAKKFM